MKQNHFQLPRETTRGADKFFGPTQAWEAVINQQGRDRTGSPDDLAGKTGERFGGFSR